MRKTIVVIAFSIALAGCNKFGETNTSPTLLTEASTKAILTNSGASVE